MSPSDISVLLAELVGIKEDISEIKEDVKETKAEVKRTNGRVGKLETAKQVAEALKRREDQEARQRRADQAAAQQQQQDAQQRVEGALNRKWGMRTALVGAMAGASVTIVGYIIGHVAHLI